MIFTMLIIEVPCISRRPAGAGKLAMPAVRIASRTMAWVLGAVCGTALITGPVGAQTPAADNRTPTAVGCLVRHSDCAREIAVVEDMIRSEPQLADLRRRTDARLARLSARMNKDAAQALAEDEARYRRSLRRDLFSAPDHAALDDEARIDLGERLQRRLGWLERIRTGEPHLAGYWANASGELVIEERAPGHFSVSAGLVEIDFLKWTCELTGGGVERGRRLTADLGQGERLELQLRHGVLHSIHVSHNGSTFCGAGGHANGAWFNIDPPPNQKGYE